MRLDQLRPSDMKATVDATAKRGLAPRTIQAANGGPVGAANFRLRVYGPAVRAIGLEGVTFRFQTMDHSHEKWTTYWGPVIGRLKLVLDDQTASCVTSCPINQLRRYRRHSAARS